MPVYYDEKIDKADEQKISQKQHNDLIVKALMEKPELIKDKR